AQWDRRGVYLWALVPGGGGRDEDAVRSARGLSRHLWSPSHTRVDGLRPRWRRPVHGGATGSGGCQADWYSAPGQTALASCRGSPRAGAERARQDRRHHRHPEEREIQVQQAQGTSVADAGDGRSEVYSVVQSEQVDAGCSTGWQIREKGMESDRRGKRVRVERG